MSKMDDSQLLDLLQRKEESAGSYVWGQLGSEREQALREYHRLPYGNEEEGWSTIVSSDIQDTVEWILPALLKTFSSTDKAVQFEPTKAADVASAEQATDAVNYVFHKQNNGFLTLYTAFKDMLTVRNCAVMWRKETTQVVSTVPFKGATGEMLAMLTEEQGEIMEANPTPMMDEQGQPVIDPMTGQPVMAFNGRIKRTEDKTVIKVEAFSPEDLLIDREWTSPLLADCPYVARMMRVSLSELKQMGFDVEPEELRGSDGADHSADASFRLNKINQEDISSGIDDNYSEDDSLAEGWLRIEFVLVDVDGDGIAERHCVYRLQNKILKDEIVSHVPIATCSPVLNSHRWDGMSIGDLVGDLQKMHTELLRQTFNSSYLANNPRTKVLTDANWSPLANIDDLLDSRPGGVIRVRDLNAVTEQITPFVAGATLPLLEYIQTMRENRTGVSRTSQGMNPDSLNNTATGRQIDQTSAQQRIELIARIAAEILLKPIFAGILKLLTDGGMEKLAFRLRDEFVEYDPNEWRDAYDMTINVGLGTGDKAAQGMQLQTIYQMQMAGMQFGLANPANLYHTTSKMIENAGYKDVQNFLTDPKNTPPAPPQPPIELQIEQMKQQADQQKFQAQSQQEQQNKQLELQHTMQLEQIKAEAKLQEVQANLELQASNDQRDGEREAVKSQMAAQIASQRLMFDKWKAELDARVQLRIAKIGQEQTGDELMSAVDDEIATNNTNPMDKLAEMHLQTLAMIGQLVSNMNAPKQIVRDLNGKAIGVQAVTNG